MKHSVLTRWVKPAYHMAFSNAKAQLVRKVRQANTPLLLHTVQIHLNWENGSSLSIRRHPTHLAILYFNFYTSLKEYIVFQMKVGGWSGWWCRKLCCHRKKNSTALGSCCLFPTMDWQLVDIMNGWNRNQGEHVNELSSTYFSCLPVWSSQDLKHTLKTFILTACKTAQDVAESEVYWQQYKTVFFSKWVCSKESHFCASIKTRVRLN